ncbi:unnamed protein product [Ilex paraguariensis]|uniref:Uncharacterized protein n=1 Tax=Ilex paraguariensis TaxID=185542 RepID=A0ABC8QYP2_9AQUA
MAIHKSLLEVTFTGVVTLRLRIHWQEHICKGIISLVGINVYLQASVHLLVVLQKDTALMEYLSVIHIVLREDISVWKGVPSTPTSSGNPRDEISRGVSSAILGAVFICVVMVENPSGGSMRR